MLEPVIFDKVGEVLEIDGGVGLVNEEELFIDEDFREVVHFPDTLALGDECGIIELIEDGAVEMRGRLPHRQLLN